MIVTEGTKTEPNYFKEIRRAYRLQTANVAVLPSALGTAPLQVVEYAQDLFAHGDPSKKIARKAFDQVYVVFDRDQHKSFHTALDRADQLNGTLRNDLKERVPFVAVASVPNFELWLLLHFEDILHPIDRDETMTRLRQQLRDYEKGSTDAFARTREHLPTALARAARLGKRFSARDEPEPFTAVGSLVELLINLGR